MIVNAFSAENLLTFGTFEVRLEGLHCTILGPNGGGKSQVVRLLDLVQKGLDSVSGSSRGQRFVETARQTLQSYAAARHYGESPDRPSVVRLEVAFTTAAERLWILTYLRAAVLNSVLQELSSGDQAVYKMVAQWVEAEITEERIAPLFTGTMVLGHASLPHLPWDISYEFTHNDTCYAWVLSTHVTNVIVRASEIIPGVRSIPQRRLIERLLDITTIPSQPLTQIELPGFDFGRLCSEPGSATTAPVLHVGTSVFDQELQPFRAAITTIGIPAQAQGQHVFPFGYVLSALLNDGVIVIGEQLRGLGTGGTPPQHTGPYSWEALSSPVRGHAPWELPLRLFELKNGTPVDKRRFEQVRRFFTTLAPGRTFDVTFQAVSLGGISAAPIGAGQTAILGQGSPGETSDQDQPGAVITVTVDRIGSDDIHPSALPIQLQGAGTWEALVLAEALAEAPDRFLVLDEPAVTLHPSWQRVLRSQLKAAEGQVLLITHSADLVSMEDGADLGRLVRLENETGQTRVHRFNTSGLNDAEVSKITRDFALSTDAVSLLFARGVVLVEGETELGALPKWLAHASHGLATPSELDLAFWSVGSDTHFQTYITVLNALAIPWALACDGAAFDVAKRQKSKLHIFSQVLNGGVDAPELAAFMDSFEQQQRKRFMDTTLFDEEKQLGKKHGVHTLALGWTLKDKNAGTANDESFEAFIESVLPGQLALAEDEVGDSKVRRGRWIADNVDCPAEVSTLYKDLVASLKRRGLSS